MKLVIIILFTSVSLFGQYESQYPPAHSSTYVKATTTSSSNFAYVATNPASSLTGGDGNNGNWLSGLSNPQTNQRFHIDLGSAKIITRIYYHNYHQAGTNTHQGSENFTFWGSNSSSDFNDLVYANNGTWTQITTAQSTFDRHVDSDVADPKYITVTNTTAYRYYGFKIADNYGGSFGEGIGLRRVELQSSAVSGSKMIMGTRGMSGIKSLGSKGQQ